MAEQQGAPLERQFGDVRVPMLIAMAGLPGSGKSTHRGDHRRAHRRHGDLGRPDRGRRSSRAGIDSDQPTGLAAYLVAETMAEQVLLSGHSVVVDAVNAVEPARLQWRDLAERCDVKLRVIEAVCSDDELHEERLVEAVGARRRLRGRAERRRVRRVEGRLRLAAARHARHRRSARRERRHGARLPGRTSVLILLPPSETKRDGGAGSPLALDRLRFPSLHPVRREVVDAVVSLVRRPRGVRPGAQARTEAGR